MDLKKVAAAYGHGMPKGPPRPALEALPTHAKRMAHGGVACLHCGGAVGEDGYAEGGEVPEDDNIKCGPEESAADDAGKSHGFVLALKGRK